MKEIAVFISAVCACAAFILALAVYLQSRSLIERMERPAFTLGRPTSKSTNTDPHHRYFNFPFKNIGKVPATNVCVQVGICPKNKPQDFKSYSRVLLANRIDPDTEMIFIKDLHFTLPVQSPTIESRAETNVLFYILITYNDAHRTNRNYHEEFFLEYFYGEGSIDHAKVEDYLVLKPYVKKIYGASISLRKKNLIDLIVQEILDSITFRKSERHKNKSG